MEEVSLVGIDGYVTIKFLKVYGFAEEKNYLGIYDIKAEIAIKSQHYLVTGELWTDMGEIFNLINELELCQKA